MYKSCKNILIALLFGNYLSIKKDRINIVNACLEWGDLRVKAPNSRKHENNVDKRYIHPNKQSLGHLGEQKAYPRCAFQRKYSGYCYCCNR